MKEITKENIERFGYIKLLNICTLKGKPNTSLKKYNKYNTDWIHWIYAKSCKAR